MPRNPTQVPMPGQIVRAFLYGPDGEPLQLDDTDKLAVSLYGQVTVAGDTPVLLDSSGRVVVAGALVDDAAFTVASSRVQPMGALLDDTSTDTVDEGDIGAVRMSSSRVLLANPATQAGASAAIADDAAFTVATSGVVAMGALADETSPDSVDEGDIGAPRMTLNRILRMIPSLHDGTTEGADSMRGNVEGTALASAARTAETNSADITNHNARGVMIFFNVSVASGTGGLQVALQVKDPISGNYERLNTLATAVTTTGLRVLAFYPGYSTAGNIQQANAMALPRTWRINIQVGDGSSYTYSVGYCTIV